MVSEKIQFEMLYVHILRPRPLETIIRLKNLFHGFLSLEHGVWMPFFSPWIGMKPCIFPPFSLISRILNKVIEDKVEIALLVVPHWISQSWFPLLISVMIPLPIRIPRHKDILTLPHSREFHPLGQQTSLVGDLVSGIAFRVRDFHQKLPTLYNDLGDQGPKSNILWHGGSGVFGLYHNRLIRFVPLK